MTIQYDDGSANSGINVKQTITVKPYVGDHRHTYDGGSWYADAASHWHQCTDKDCPDLYASTKDLASHTFVWKIDKAATATETGLKHEECTVCGFERNETEIPTRHGGRPDTKPDGGAENTATSPKTGDAGIALYGRAVPAGAERQRMGRWQKAQRREVKFAFRRRQGSFRPAACRDGGPGTL